MCPHSRPAMARALGARGHQPTMASPLGHPLSPSQDPPSAAPQPQCNACNHGSMHTHAHMHACQSTGSGFKLNHARPAAARPGRGSGQTTHVCTWQCILALHVCPTMLASACSAPWAMPMGQAHHHTKASAHALPPKPSGLLLLVACGSHVGRGFAAHGWQAHLTTPRHTSHSHPA